MLKTLENYIGREKMDQVMRSFFQRWKFHHPHSDDFIAEVNRVTGKDFNWFFDALLKGSEDVDYEVRYVRTGKDREDVGLFDEGGEKVLLPRKPDSSAVATPDSGATEPELYTSVVRVHRIGEFIIPVDILLVFENGDSLTTRWDGKERWFKYTVQRESKLAWAEVDPKHVLVLDKDFCNNSKTVSARKGPVNYITSRFLMFFETAMNVIGFMG